MSIEFTMHWEDVGTYTDILIYIHTITDEQGINIYDAYWVFQDEYYKTVEHPMKTKLKMDQKSFTIYSAILEQLCVIDKHTEVGLGHTYHILYKYYVIDNKI